MKIKFCFPGGSNTYVSLHDASSSGHLTLRQALECWTSELSTQAYFLNHGRIVDVDSSIQSLLLSAPVFTGSLAHCSVDLEIDVMLRVLGGKGGFGTLLRTQKSSKKTTNFGSTRLADGRRLRDVINERTAAEIERNREIYAAEQEQQRERERQERAAAALIEENNLAEKRKKIVDRLGESLNEGLAAARSREEQEAIEKEQLLLAKKRSEARAAALLFGDPSDESEDELGDAGPERTDDQVSDGAASDPSPSPSPSHSSAFVNSAIPSPSPTSSKDLIESKKRDREDDPTPSTIPPEPDFIDLMTFESCEQLRSLGLDGLKRQLALRDMKMGGTLQQRAERLWEVRGLSLDEIRAKTAEAARPTKKRRVE